MTGMTGLESAHLLWPMAIFVISTSFFCGIVWHKIIGHERQIRRLFKYHDECMKEFRALTEKMRNGGIRVESCPYHRNQEG